MKPLHNLGRWALLCACFVAVSSLAQQEDIVQETGADMSISEQIQDLKTAALELNRDLLILEEELLYPAQTQVAVFVSADVGELFRLEAVELRINDKLVASHLYTDRQNLALHRGGVQRLFIGNLKNGAHEVTAFLTGIGPDDREYKRAATTTLEKDQAPKMLELRIQDSSDKMQPEFNFKEWQL